MSKVIKGSSRFKGYERPRVEEHFDFADLVRRQIERCLIAAGDPEFRFPEAVEVLEALIPQELQDDEYKGEWERAVNRTKDVKVIRITSAGLEIGRENDPMVWNEDHTDLGFSSEYGFNVMRLEDESIDWDDPNIYSPYYKQVIDIDWMSRFEAAFNMFVRLGIAVRRTPRG